MLQNFKTLVKITTNQQKKLFFLKPELRLLNPRVFKFYDLKKKVKTILPDLVDSAKLWSSIPF